MKRQSRHSQSEYGEVERRLATETRRVKLSERVFLASSGLALAEYVLLKADVLGHSTFEHLVFPTLALGALDLAGGIISSVREQRTLIQREVLMKDLLRQLPERGFLDES